MGALIESRNMILTLGTSLVLGLAKMELYVVVIGSIIVYLALKREERNESIIR